MRPPGVAVSQSPQSSIAALGAQAALGLAAPARPRAARLGVVVVEHLVDRIVAGAFPPGSSLPPEPILCEEFGVSRTVIRESVKVLEEKGLVRVAQGRGTHVTAPELWNLLDPVVLTAVIRHDGSLSVLDELVAVRVALECEMAAETATRSGEAGHQRIEAALEQMRHLVGEAVSFGAQDVLFHDVIMELSGNRLGRAIVNTVHEKARTSDLYHGQPSIEGMRLALAEHERIYAAICNGDPAEARATMREHISVAWQRRRRPVA